MSIQIIEIKYPFNDKSDFHSRVISYSDFGTYTDDIKRNTNDVLVFKRSLNKLNLYYKNSYGDVVVHQAWLLTE